MKTFFNYELLASGYLGLVVIDVVLPKTPLKLPESSPGLVVLPAIWFKNTPFILLSIDSFTIVLWAFEVFVLVLWAGVLAFWVTFVFWTGVLVFWATVVFGWDVIWDETFDIVVTSPFITAVPFGTAVPFTVAVPFDTTVPFMGAVPLWAVVSFDTTVPLWVAVPFTGAV